MSDPVTIISAVSMVMGVKTALDGAMEGNLFKAVVGGVSAYMGGSGLTAAQSSTNAAGAAGGGVDAVSGTVMDASNVVTDAATNTALDSATSLSSDMTNLAGNGASFTGVDPNLASFASENGAALNNALPEVGASFADKVSDMGGGLLGFAKENPTLISGGMKMAGGLLQGYGQEQLYKEKWKRDDDERKRRSTSANTDFLSRLQYNPTTGKFA
jgi:hypothetical protein